MVRPRQPEIRVPCVEGCGDDFSGTAEMVRHVDERHRESKRCTEVGCSFKTKRLSRLRKHKEKKHAYKVDLELGDGSILHANSSTVGQMTSQPQAPASQQTTSGYGYPESSLQFQYSHGESSGSLHSIGSSLSSASNRLDMSTTIDLASQMNATKPGFSYDLHPPMILPPTAYNNIAANMPTFWGRNIADDGETPGAGLNLEEQYLGTDWQGKVNSNPRYT